MEALAQTPTPREVPPGSDARPSPWTLNAEIVCRNGKQPDRGLDALTFVYAAWPPQPLQWSYAPATESLHLQTTAADSDTYLGLVTDDEAADNLIPVAQQEHRALAPGDYFPERVPMIKFASSNSTQGNPLPRGVHPVRFYAPDGWCEIPPPAPKGAATVEVITFNHTYTVRWDMSEDAGSTVRIELSTDNGVTWEIIQASAANGGALTLPSSNTSAEAARVRITSIAKPALSLVSQPFPLEASGGQHPHHHHEHGHHRDDDDEETRTEHSHHHGHDRHDD